MKVSELIKERNVSTDNQVKTTWFVAEVDGDGTHDTVKGEKYRYIEALEDTKAKSGREYKKGDWMLIKID